MERYDVFLYSLPKLTEDGKGVLPGPTSKHQPFDALEPAQKFAVEQQAAFERVVVIKVDDQGQHLVERYVDGRRETPDQIVRR
jgi:hypothetical protein